MLVTLSGELGAGKTTLVRAFLVALGHTGPVPSPTYTLVEPYTLDCGRFFHVDLYRLGSADELEFLGWSDIREGFAIVEWPERAGQLAETANLAIELAYRATGREARLRARTQAAAAWLARAEVQTDAR